MEKRRETMIELKKIKGNGGIRENRRMYRENKKRLRHSNIKKEKMKENETMVKENRK